MIKRQHEQVTDNKVALIFGECDAWNKRRWKRFSVFDICTDNLAAMIDALLVGGYIKDVGGSFPWTEVELAPKALEMIKHRLPE